MKVKNKVSNDKKNGVVYEILCRDCKHVYMGETKRTRKRRIVEHKQAVKKSGKKNGVAVHVNTHDHHINWEEAKVVTYSEAVFFGVGEYKKISGSEHKTVP